MNMEKNIVNEEKINDEGKINSEILDEGKFMNEEKGNSNPEKKLAQKLELTKIIDLGSTTSTSAPVESPINGNDECYNKDEDDDDSEAYECDKNIELNDKWELANKLDFLLGTSNKELISNAESSSSVAAGSASTSSGTNETHDNIPKDPKHVCSRINDIDHRENNALCQLKNKEVLMIISKLLEPLDYDTLLDVNLKILRVIHKARANKDNYE